MVDNKQINAFINYNYIPFNKKQCIKRIILIWLFSAMLSIISNMKVFWILLLGCIDLVLSVFFIILIVKYSHSKISRFLCDGIFFLYVSIVLNLASYMMMTIQGKSNILLCLVLLSLLFICIFLVLLMTYYNIKSNKFCETKKQKHIIFTPFYSAVVGIIVAKLLLKGQSQQEILSFMAYVLLILSFLTGIPSIILLKAWLYKRYKDE